MAGAKAVKSLTKAGVVPAEVIEQRIRFLRGQKVVIDMDLASLYQVPTKALNQAVKRNLDRFPEDFMFQLTRAEAAALRSQIVTLNSVSRGRHAKYAPYVFTEQGVAMLSSILKSKRAVQVNVAIMRAFVRMREVMATHKDLARKIERLERKYTDHDNEIQVIFRAIKKLLAPPVRSRTRIGFAAP